MRVVVSPYHLTTREPPAMAALLLARRVVTMIPSPEVPDRAGVERATEAYPAYLRMLDSWRWSLPLWEAGVIGTSVDGQTPDPDVREASERIAREPEWAPLKPLVRSDAFEPDAGYLDAISRDLLKGGPDPALSVPVAAGLDEFAARHGMWAMRADPASVAQRVEARLGRRVLAIAFPCLVRADGAGLLHARTVLEPELETLRDAFDDPEPTPARVAEAAARLQPALERELPTIRKASEDVRVVVGMASLTLSRLPGDAVLRSSLQALRSLTGAKPDRRPGAALAVAARPGAPVLAGFVKVMGRPARP